MSSKNNNYSKERDTLENFNVDEKYAETGESEFSRDSTVPFDQDEVLTERHYNFGPLERSYGRQKISMRDPQLHKNAIDGNHKGKGPKGYRRTDDLIKEDICEALYRNTGVDASEIEIFVKDGVVKITGFVTSPEQKMMAESAIENLTGIDEIFNDLSVRSESEKNPPLPPRGLMNNITGLN
jgi:hypothetical protein